MRKRTQELGGKRARVQERNREGEKERRRKREKEKKREGEKDRKHAIKKERKNKNTRAVRAQEHGSKRVKG